MSSLPDRPSLTSLRKQAKSLLKSARENDADALEQVNLYHPKPDTFSTLRDAQLVLARRYGHDGWLELCEAVETALDAAQSLSERASLFADLACLCYSPDENIRRRERAIRLLEESPALTSSDIYAAAAAADVGAIRLILDSDPSLASQPGGPRTWSPLMYVTYSRIDDAPPSRDSVACLQLLLDAGADPRFYVDGSSGLGGWHWTALTGAIGEGEGGRVQQPPHPRARELAGLLLEGGADPNDGQGLYNSMFSPDNEWLELLISHGLTVRALADSDSDSAVTTLNYQLSFAVKSGFTERVALLLEQGADAAGKDDWYKGPTHIDQAVQSGLGDVIDLLVAHRAPKPTLSTGDHFRIAVVSGDRAEAEKRLDAEPDLRDQPDLMMNAAHHGRIEPVKLLLDLGSDPNQLASNGRGVLHEAAWSGNVEIVRLLLDRGASCEVRDGTHNGTPANWADHAGRFDVRDLILEHSNDVFSLARFGKADRLRVLLRDEPTLATATRSDGRTPLHFVESNGTDGATVIDLLLEHGADINATTDEGATPLSAALARENEAAMELLRERGATK